MKRTTIYLPESMKVSIESAALRAGVTEAEVIRQAVRTQLESQTPAPPEFSLFSTELQFDLAGRCEELLGQRSRSQ